MKNWFKHFFSFVLLLLINTGVVWGQKRPAAISPAFSESSSSASISKNNHNLVQSVQLSGNVFLEGGNRLVSTQNSDGGWGWPLNGSSALNTIGPITMGLAQTYQQTGDASQRAAMVKAGNILLAKTNNFSPSDGYLAAQLDKIFGGSTYKNHVLTNFYNKLTAGTYNRNGAGTFYSTSSYISQVMVPYRAGTQSNMASWDLGMGLVGAAMCGAPTTDWITGVKAEINKLDPGVSGAEKTYDVIGLAGALYGLAYVHSEFDPTSGAHAAASNLGDLANILASYQINNGGFSWNANWVIPNDNDECIQETAYSILALNAVNRSTYLNKIVGAANYLSSVQLATGGFKNWSGDEENNEVTGEALWGLSTAFPAPIYNVTKDVYYSTIQSAISDASTGNILTVAAGTYAETVTVNKAIAINGNGAPTVTKFILAATPVTITGFNPATVIDLGTGGSVVDAIAATPIGGTVNIPPGTYHSFVVGHSITLNGHGAIVEHSSPSITVQANNVTITDFVFNNLGSDFAIQIDANYTGTHVHYCNFNTPNAVHNLGAGTVDATNNYWGTLIQSAILSKIVGTGVTSDPWYGKNVAPAILTPTMGTVGISATPNLSWTNATLNATDFKLQVSTTNDFSAIVINKTLSNNTTTYTFNAADLAVGALAGQNTLSNSTVYYWRIFNTVSSSVVEPLILPQYFYSFTTISTAMPYLTMPSNGAELIGTTTTFAWYSSTQAINYTLEINTAADFSGTAIPGTTTSNTYFTVINSQFIQGGVYYWRVTSKTIEANPRIINISNVWQFRMPGLPQPIASSPTVNSTIYINPPTLYWYTLAYNAKATGYRIKYGKTLTGAGDIDLTGHSLDVPAQINNNGGYFNTNSLNSFITIPAALDAGAKYYWQVASSDGTNLSDWSPMESFSVYGNATFLACYASYPVGGSAVYSSKPTLYWYSNVYAPVMYYRVRYASTIGGLSGNGTDVSTNSFTFASALTAGTYYWQVQGSLDGTNFGSWSAPASFVVSSTTTAAAIATPFLTSPISGITINVINPTLTWASYSVDPLMYRVTWSTNPAIDPLTGTFTVSSGTTTWVSSSSFVLGSLTAGASYYWQVQARSATNASNVGSWSSVGWFTVSAGAASVVPIAGSPINGTPINNSNATLSWVLPTQSTSALKYDLQYSKTADFTSGVSTVSNVEKANVDVKNLDKNALYYWRVASKTSGGEVSSYSAPTSFSTGSSKITGVEKTESLPTDFELSQNYPNPFNPTTIINYALPTNSYVSLKVYDMLGREVKTLVNSQVVAGRHSIEWRGDDNSGSKVGTGVYIYRVTADNFVSTKKMLLIK